jgi:DNA-binding transcriptional regulator YiaG
MVDTALYEKVWTKRRIKALRKKHRISRRVLGLLTGVTGNAVYQWERGLRQPPWSTHILLSYIERDLNK